MENNFLEQFAETSRDLGVETEEIVCQNYDNMSGLISTLEEQIFKEKREIEQLRLENQRLSAKEPESLVKRMDVSVSDFEILQLRTENEEIHGTLQQALEQLSELERQSSDLVCNEVKQKNEVLEKEVADLTNELAQTREAFAETQCQLQLTGSQLQGTEARCEEISEFAEEIAATTEAQASKIGSYLSIQVPLRTNQQINLICRVLDEFGLKLFGSSWPI